MKLPLRKRTYIAIFSCLVIISISIAVLSSNGLMFNREKFPEEKSLSDICTEINRLSKRGANIEDLSYLVGTLEGKLGENPEKELLGIIKDTSNSENLRVISAQILENVSISDDVRDEILSSVFQESGVSSLKQNLLWLFDSGSAADLESLVFGEDEALSIQALKQMTIIDAERAKSLAKRIIDSSEGSESLSEALGIISKQMRKNTDVKEKDEWVAFCLSIFNKSKMESAVYALSDMAYIGGISAIVNNEDIDEGQKRFAISQNYHILVEALKNSPSEELIYTAIKAVEINPIDKIVYALASAIEEHESGEMFQFVAPERLSPAVEKWSVRA